MSSKNDINVPLKKLGITIDEMNKLTEMGEVVKLDSMFFEKKKSKIHGYGIFALTTIRTQSLFGMASIDNKYKTYLGRYVNHSNEPNIKFIYTSSNDLAAVAIKDIQKGEEILVDYASHFLNPEFL